MRYIAAYLLLQLGGQRKPTADNIKNLLSVAGVEVEEDRLKALLAELEGKNIDQLIEEGSKQLASVGSAVAVGGGGGAAGGAAAGGEAAKEEAKEEEKEESDDDMGFGLFD